MAAFYWHPVVRNVALVLMSLALLVPVSSAQQAEPTEARLKEMLTMVRGDLQKDRIQAVTQGMNLNASQAARFWPVYEKYTAGRENSTTP